MDFFPALHLEIPELILSAASLRILVFGAVRGDKGMTSVSALCGASLIAAAFAAALFTEQGTVYNGAFIVDGVALFTKTAIYIAAVLSIVLGQGYFDRVGSRRFEFPVLILLTALGMSMMVSAGDLISFYIGLEMQSLAM